MRPIVYYYPSIRWDDTFPSRQHKLMAALSELHPVVFLDSPHFTGSFLDMRKPRFKAITPNLTLIEEAFGWRQARLGRKLGKISAMQDGLWLKKLLAEHGITEYIYWMSSPSPEMLVGMRTDRLVYDCIDPCFLESQQAAHDVAEREVAQQAKLVFCTAESLQERLLKWNPKSVLLPNGCDPATNHPDKTTAIKRPDRLKDVDTPIIGFMGTFDWRIDSEILAEAARRLPEYTFALPGRINADQKDKLTSLMSLPNVVMPGSVSEEDGQAYTAAFDVGLIPFRPGEMNDAINPVKMFMYMIAGKPIVSTWVRECRRYAPYVTAAKDVDAFVEAIRRAVEDNSPEAAAQRVAFASKNSWHDRAVEALEQIKAAGLL